MNQDFNGLSLRDLVDGLLFSLQAEGKSPRTIEYYRDRLKAFVTYCENDNVSEVRLIDANEIRRFLSWVGSRTVEYEIGNGAKRHSGKAVDSLSLFQNSPGKPLNKDSTVSE